MPPSFFKNAASYFMEQHKRANLLRHELTQGITTPAKNWMSTLYEKLFKDKKEPPPPEKEVEAKANQ